MATVNAYRQDMLSLPQYWRQKNLKLSEIKVRIKTITRLLIILVLRVLKRRLIKRLLILLMKKLTI